MVKYPKALGFIGANTHPQLRQIVLEKLFGILREQNIKYEYNENTGILKALGATVKCSGLDNFDALRGAEYGYFWLDEVRDLKEEAFLMLCGRLRDSNGPLEGRCTTTPAGFNWVYEHFKGEKKTEHHELIQTTSYENPFLPDGYLEALRGSYDPRFYEQEVLGKFLNLTSGQVYRSFNRDSNVIDRLPFEPGTLPIKIGMDFNVNPMTAVLASEFNGQMYVFAEAYLEDSNTFDMARHISDSYGMWRCPISIIPDSTGKNRKTSSTQSDHQILRSRGFTVEFQTNPKKTDRYNCVNGLLHHKKLWVHSSCVKTIKDLQQVVYEGNPAHLTHISDALGYLCWKWKPLKTPAPPSGAIHL
jgi:PBSX family phage terminase large subunit